MNNLCLLGFSFVAGVFFTQLGLWLYYRARVRRQREFAEFLLRELNKPKSPASEINVFKATCFQCKVDEKGKPVFCFDARTDNKKESENKPC